MVSLLVFASSSSRALEYRSFVKESLKKGGRALGNAASAALEIGTPPAWLGPALTAAFERAAQPPADGATAVQAEARLGLARALWHVSGHAAPLVTVVMQVLQPPARDMTLPRVRRQAASAACELGPAAQALLPVLLPLLNDPELCPIATHVLPLTWRAASSSSEG